MTFNFGSAKVHSAVIFESCFCYNKDIWIAATYYHMYFYIFVLFDSYSPINKFYSFIILILLINAVILLLNCLILILYLYMLFFLFDIIFSTLTLFEPLYN